MVIICLLVLLCSQCYGFDIIGLPRYIVSQALWRLENRNLSSQHRETSPLWKEPLYSYEFSYVPRGKNKLREGTTIKQQLDKIEQSFIQLKNLFAIPDDEWQKIEQDRKKTKEENTLIIALQQPRIFFSHNPFISSDMIRIAEKVFSILGLNLYSCDLALTSGIKAYKVRIEFTQGPSIKPTIYIDARFTDTQEDQNLFISKLLFNLMEIIGEYDTDDAFIRLIEKKYLTEPVDKAKQIKLGDIKDEINNIRGALKEGVESYVKEIYDES